LNNHLWMNGMGERIRKIDYKIKDDPPQNASKIGKGDFELQTKM